MKRKTNASENKLWKIWGALNLLELAGRSNGFECEISNVKRRISLDLRALTIGQN